MSETGNVLTREENLDPDDWEKFRESGHNIWNDVVNYLKIVRERPVWKEFPSESRRFLDEKLPKEGMPFEDVYADFKNHIFPYTKGNIHPRFWAWVQGTGIPSAVVADMLASAMNPNVTIGEHSAMYVDRQVLNWCKEIMCYPETAGGMLVSGASMANLTALTVARNTFFPDIIEAGVSKYGNMIVYASAQAHSCVDKAVQVLGIGLKNLKKIHVDSSYQMDLYELQKSIEADIQAGNNPFCVIATLGTVNTGALDDIEGIREISDKYKLWMHIDGAFGALSVLSNQYGHLKNVVSLSDSIAFDLHKWMYFPYEAGCVLVKDGNAHRDAFSITPEYLLQHDKGLASGPEPLNNYGIELSRNFKALKIWMVIREFGIRKFGNIISQNIRQAVYLAELINKEESLELMAPVSLNIVCFRFINPRLDEKALNLLNKELCMRLQTDGIASPSSTLLNGKYALRVAITNHRSIKSDFDLLIDACLNIGQQLVALSEIPTSH